MIEDTSKRDNEIHYLGFKALGADRYIGGMERTGQQSLVVSADLPTKSPNADEEFEALGFTLGEPHKHDPLFRPATLPAGWRKQAKEHAMGSAVVDELGRERVSVFYKALAAATAMGADSGEMPVEDIRAWVAACSLLKPSGVSQ